MASADENRIYSATYSSVPVYEFKLGPDNVMRRRSDDWINATHILKAAGFDKPARTRVLEREVQKGVHEKVQGGYGKYQGTWVPLQEGRSLAERNNILDKLLPIFDFVPGDRSPPPAPKHTTAASTRQKNPKVAAHGKRAPRESASFTALKSSFPPVVAAPTPNTSFYQEQYDNNNNANSQFNDDESIERATLESSSMIAEEDMVPMSQHSTQSRKRKRTMNEGPVMSMTEQDHVLYGDELLDYFMTVGDAPGYSRIVPPDPPLHFQVNRPIDDQGNTALHWACSMGDLDIIRDLLNRGGTVNALTRHDETPLVRAVLFTNNYEKGTMPELVNLLQDTITYRDWFGATVFHHLAETTRSKGKWKSSRYYGDVLVNKLNELFPHHETSALLSCVDSNGDTAALVAARNGCLRLANFLISQCPEAADHPNKKGETANELLREFSRPARDYPPAPSSVIHGGDRSSLPDGDNAVHGAGDDTSPSRLPNSGNPTAATEALLAKISSVMDDANKKLTLVYGNSKWNQDGSNDVENPQGLYEHVESDRQNIHEQTDTLIAKENESEQIDIQLKRYEEVRRNHGSLLEQTQHPDLLNRFQAALALDSENKNSSSSSQPPTTTDLAATYHLALELSQAQQTRRAAIHELTQQRADAGVSTKLDVHRRLVSLATGLQEDELDPMSAELAETLEFDRANGKRSGTGTPEDGPEHDETSGMRRDSMEVSMARSALAVDA